MGVGKEEQYLALVKKRKEHVFSEGLLNPSAIENGEYDTKDHLGPWSTWQGNLDARILLIGQDWGNVEFYRKNKGNDTDDNPTNQNLAKLFDVIGIDIGTPNNPNFSAPVFFTNIILGIKQNGNMSSKVHQAWAKESADLFLAPLLEIICPKTIITLGYYAFREISRIYSLRNRPLKELILDNPLRLGDKKIYAMYHCGRLGLANRNFQRQKEDWSRIDGGTCLGT